MDTIYQRPPDLSLLWVVVVLLLANCVVVSVRERVPNNSKDEFEGLDVDVQHESAKKTKALEKSNTETGETS